MNSRRNFLKQLSGAALIAGAAPSLLTWAQSVQVPGEDRLILRSFRFVDLETPVEDFNTWLTPVPHFFVRNHMFEPSQLDASDWRLALGGELEKPLTLSLAELSRFEPHSVVNTLECAGNGRSLHRPLFWSALARCAAARRSEAFRQARHVPWTRRSSRQSPSLHSQHPDRESSRCRYPDRHPHERVAAHQASRFSRPRSRSRL